MALDHFHRTEEPEGTLNIGIMETICSSDYTNFFNNFLEKYPKISLHLEVVTTFKAMEDLDKGIFDLIFLLDEKILRPNWKTARTFPADISFFCASSHPSCRAGRSSFGTSPPRIFYPYRKGCNYRNVFEKDLMDAGYVLKCIAEVGHTSYIIKAVARQLGIGLLPVFTLKDALEKGEIALIGVKDYRISLSIQVIYNTQRMLSLPLKVFLNELQHFYIPE